MPARAQQGWTALRHPARPAAGGRADAGLRAYRRLAVAVGEAVPEDAQPSPAQVQRIAADAANHRALATYLSELMAGATDTQALLASVRAVVGLRRFPDAWRLVEAFEAREDLAQARGAAAVVINVGHNRWDRARAALRRLPTAVAEDLVPAEIVATELARGDVRAAAARAQALLESGRDLHPQAWLGVARTAFTRGEYAVAAAALDRIDAADAPAASHVVAYETRWLRRWLRQADHGVPPRAPAAGHITFGVLDYRQPDLHRMSANIGDYVQTIASLGHVVRHQDLRFHGRPKLVDELERLQSQVRPEFRRHGVAADVDVVPVSRDASNLDNVPPGTWMLAFGWYMHSWFRIRYDFPFHPNLRPIFVSFHVNHTEALTPESIDYLRRHGPIGCRDWATVHRLLDLDVPAFFSGCLTTTVNTVFPDVADAFPADAPVASVDLPPGRDAIDAKQVVTIRHSGIGVSGGPLPRNLRIAWRMLDDYRTKYSRVATSRLHCYLPVRALGVDVEMRPKNPNDVRFGGLIGIDDAAFAAMQAGLRDKLERVLTSIFSGDDEATVRRIWTEVCAGDLAEARRRHAEQNSAATA